MTGAAAAPAVGSRTSSGTDTDREQVVEADLPALPTVRVDPMAPPPQLAVLRAQAPVSRVTLPAGGWAWLVTRHADVRRLLTDDRLSADPSRPGFPFVRPGLRVAARQEVRTGVFLRMDRPEHTRLRRMLTAEFMARSIDRLAPEIEATVELLLDRLVAAGPSADLIRDFALELPSRVICGLLGVPYADHVEFQARSRALMSRTASEADIQRLAADFQAYLGGLVDARIAAAREGAEAPGDDLLARLVATRVLPGELSRDELVGVGLLLLVAGIENTANSIGLAVLTLLAHPGHLARLREQPETAGPLVEEMLRFHTVVHFGVPRAVVAEIELDGQVLRPGEGVLTLLGAANRDPAAFPEPDGFDPGRDASQHVAFGHGIHQCLGQGLARTELRLALLGIARRLPTLRLAVAEHELSFQNDMAHYGVRSLPVTW